MTIPIEPELIFPVLDLMVKTEDFSSAQAFQVLADQFNLSPKERSQKLKNGVLVLTNNIAWALSTLTRNKCIEKLSAGHYQINKRGIYLYHNAPPIVDRQTLKSILATYSEHKISNSRENQFKPEQIEKNFNETNYSDLDSTQAWSFPLESHLRDFIAQNIGDIDFGNGQLKLFNGTKGIEYSTEVGFIDILATNDNGDFIVLELKLSRGPDKALGQIARYMGWVKKNLAHDKNVYGIIVVNQASDKLKYAGEIIPSISLFEYEILFSVKPVTM